jgi:hypothetical protein
VGYLQQTITRKEVEGANRANGWTPSETSRQAARGACEKCPRGSALLHPSQTDLGGLRSMCAQYAPVKQSEDAITSLRGFYGEAWEHADRAHESAVAASDLIQQLHSPPSDLLALARLAEDTTSLFRRALERARTRAAIVGIEIEAQDAARLQRPQEFEPDPLRAASAVEDFTRFAQGVPS